MITQAIKHYSDYKTGGMAGSYFFNNRWLGLIVAIPLCALYIYQVYQVQADYREQHTKKKHTNKYR